MKVTMENIAKWCHRAEDGDGESAARELARHLDPKSIDRLIKYSELKEEDILSFYELKHDVEISGVLGVFTLSAENRGPNLRITPIGLYALSMALKDLDGF